MKGSELPRETLEWFGNDELRARVFIEKYAFRDYEGNVIEKTPPEMWRRIAKAIASVEETEEKRKEWEEKFYWLLEDFRMIPGGRIMFGAGQTRRKATLLNCYVLPIKGDSIEDIYDTMKEMARTYSYGGGVGVDISVLRPKGSPVENAAYTSTGAVSFMDLYSLTTGTIGQCLEENTLVLTREGWKKIKDIRVGDLVWTHEGWQRVSYVFPKKKMVVYRVKTRRGFEIVASLDHKFVDEAFNLKPLEDFSVGDRIVMLRAGETKREDVDGYLLSYSECEESLEVDTQVCEMLLTSPPGVIVSFLAKLFDRVGYVEEDVDGNNGIGRRFVFVVSSLDVAKSIQLVLLTLGIVSGIERRGHDAGGVNVVVEDLDEFLERFGDYSFKLRGYVERSTRGSLRFSAEECLSLGERMGVVGEAVLEKVYREVVFVDEIVGIEKLGERCVCDIEVENTHKFMAQGFYVSNSGRRGALMITIHCAHPDVEEFITVKNDPLRMRVRYANISVLVEDEFMEAVQSDGDWELWYPDIMRESEIVKEFGTSDVGRILEELRRRDDFVEIDVSKRSFYHFPEKKYFYVVNKGELRKKRVYRVVKAKALWDKIIHNAWASAEPGVIFYSTMRRMSTSEYNDMHILTTNPCSEIPLEPYGDCCLGNINLDRFVVNEFQDDAEVDWENLERAVRYTVRFLDNVLEYSKNRHPLREQSEASMRSRRIGVGFTGLGDMLVKMRIKYDSEEAIDFVNDLFNRIKHIAYDESVAIACDKGTFPNFDARKHLRSPFIKKLDRKLQEKIKENGLRNVALLTVPPVGSGALLAGVTSGIEPIFALSYIRRSESLSQEFFKVYHPLVKRYMEKFGIENEGQLPSFFVTAHEIDPYFRVKMQATIQKHIDHSISSTVNLPEDTSERTISDIYFYAWKLGCKGITVYREGSREGVLITEEQARKKSQSKPEFKRPRILSGETLKFRLPQGSLYVTVNRDSDGVIKEVFINIGKSGGNEKADAEAIGRLISIYLQNGGNVEDVIRQLEGIKGEETFWDQGIALHSIPDAIAKALSIIHKNAYEERHLYQEQKKPAEEGETGANQKKLTLGSKMEKCPTCGEVALVNENGCFTCKSCGYTKCA